MLLQGIFNEAFGAAEAAGRVAIWRLPTELFAQTMLVPFNENYFKLRLESVSRGMVIFHMTCIETAAKIQVARVFGASNDKSYYCAPRTILKFSDSFWSGTAEVVNQRVILLAALGVPVVQPKFVRLTVGGAVEEVPTLRAVRSHGHLNLTFLEPNFLINLDRVCPGMAVGQESVELENFSLPALRAALPAPGSSNIQVVEVSARDSSLDLVSATDYLCPSMWNFTTFLPTPACLRFCA